MGANLPNPVFGTLFRRFEQLAVGQEFSDLPIFPNGMVCLICIDLRTYLPDREVTH